MDATEREFVMAQVWTTTVHGLKVEIHFADEKVTAVIVAGDHYKSAADTNKVLAALKVDKEYLAARMAERDEYIADLQAEKEELVETIAHHNRRAEELDRGVEARDQQIKDLREKVVRAQASEEAMSKYVKKTLEELRTKHSTAEASCISLTDANAALLGRIREYQTRLGCEPAGEDESSDSSTTGEVAPDEATVATTVKWLKATVERRSQELAEAYKLRDKSDETIVRLEKENGQLKDVIAERDRQISILQEDEDRLSELANELTADVDNARHRRVEEVKKYKEEAESLMNCLITVEGECIRVTEAITLAGTMPKWLVESANLPAIIGAMGMVRAVRGAFAAHDITIPDKRP